MKLQNLCEIQNSHSSMMDEHSTVVKCARFVDDLFFDDG